MRLNQKEEIQSHVRCSTAQDFENGSNASKTACWCLARRKFEDGVHRGVVGLTCLSNLPGLVNAGSRISGKFVAAIRIIPYRRQVNALGQEQVESATHQPMTEEKKNLFFFYLVLLKTIHLNKELMQCLLRMPFPLLSGGPDCVYFINKDDAWCLCVKKKMELDEIQIYVKINRVKRSYTIKNQKNSSIMT